MATEARKTAKRIKLTPEQLAAPVTKDNFFLRGQHFIDNVLDKPEKLPTIKPGQESWNVWRQYFERHLHWMPIVMDGVLRKSFVAMTVPTEFPQIFDKNFVEDADWKPPHEPRPLDREFRENYEELQRRHGPNWGLKIMPKGKQSTPDWILSEEQIRQKYMPQVPSEEDSQDHETL